MFGIAVVGSGRVAQKFLETVSGSTSVCVSALVSRDPERAMPLGRTFVIPHVLHTDDFEQQLRDAPHTQAVYLALPNLQHRKFAERAAAIGLHVLCEKPLAATIADAQAMIAACKAANVTLASAYRFVFDPAYIRMRELVQSGALGKLTSVESYFGFVLETDWRFDPALAGGGSLYDVGVYPLRALADLFPASPLVLTSAVIQRDPATQLELDTRFTATVSGAVATCRSSYIADVPDRIRLTGELGTLDLSHAFDYSGGHLHADYADSITGKRVQFDVAPAPGLPHTFRLQAEAFAAAVLAHQPPRSTGEDGLADMQAIAKIEAFATKSLHAPDAVA